MRHNVRAFHDHIRYFVLESEYLVALPVVIITETEPTKCLPSTLQQLLYILIISDKTIHTPPSQRAGPGYRSYHTPAENGLLLDLVIALSNVQQHISRFPFTINIRDVVRGAAGFTLPDDFLFHG